jgi:hypothetical protein
MRQKIKSGTRSEEVVVLGEGKIVPRLGVPRKAMGGDEYHGYDAATHTRLERGWDSAGTLHEHVTNPEPPGEPLIIGNAIHTLLLEPETYGRRYTTMPEYNLRKPDDRHAKSLFVAACAESGTIALTNKQQDTVHEAVRGAMKLTLVQDILEQPGVVEQSRYWVDSETEILCAARLDKYMQTGIAIDIKSTREINNFERSFEKYAYHRQFGHYDVGLAETTDWQIAAWVVVAIGTEAPYESLVFAVAPEAIAHGKYEMRYLRRKYRALCDAKEKDPDGWWRQQKERVLTLPAWYMRREFDNQGFVEVSEPEPAAQAPAAGTTGDADEAEAEAEAQFPTSTPDAPDDGESGREKVVEAGPQAGG